MAKYVTALFGFSLAALCAVADEKAVKAELKKFDGAWQLVSATRDGVAAPEDTVKKIRVVIKDGKHTVYFGEDAVVKDVSFTVDPTTDPKSSVDTLADDKQIKGIYKLEGDMLTSCVAEPGQERPKEFASKAGSGHTFRVFKRVK